MNSQLIAVITTIQQPTGSVLEMAARMVDKHHQLVIVGDRKGPFSYDLNSVEGFKESQLSFLNLDDQLGSDFGLAKKLPKDHYSRKNIGYLQAISSGADCIYETDDDNAPLPGWKERLEYTNVAQIQSDGKSTEATDPNWVNVYKHFARENAWPRGLPLDRIHEPILVSDGPEEVWAPIQQGLVNGSPDVDAIWRLVFGDDFSFLEKTSVMVTPGQWCPFNTQSTWWWPVAYPLLYVPSFCSFRMCDIWKSFVAQRCLWELGTGVVFHSPEVFQERNPHNLFCDFNDEVVGYQQNNRIAQILQALHLEPDGENVPRNLLQCYEALVEEKIFPVEELPLVRIWLSDLETIQFTALA